MSERLSVAKRTLTVNTAAVGGVTELLASPE
jgi:hypothetical protein